MEEDYALDTDALFSDTREVAGGAAVNLIDVTKTFQTDDDCLAYLETMRWPDVIRCPLCGCKNISKVTRKSKSKNLRTRLYQCLEPTCKQQFSATSGTIFHDSHLPLTKWFMALAIVIDAKKGVSANQLKNHLGIGSYRTAWYMAHRIRRAMETGSFELMDGTVEIDETYVGGKVHGKGTRGRSLKQKNVVVGVKQRGGRVRLKHMPDATSESLASVIKETVDPACEAVMTDDFAAYPKAMIKAGIHGTKHYTINHTAGKYVDGMVYTNGIESHFGLLKRGIIGSFHKVSIKHLHRYLSEFEYRFNTRKSGDRFSETLGQMMTTVPMPYEDLVAE